ncbi:MAG: hypothetical protein NTY03_04235, partial [Candidatus Bathyarchaeota archaeon]|nr:hypothetical protein [Candidatus Bathyarchaeota archaeon]
HEAQAVNEIKRTQRFTVVTGNPPYSYESANTSEHIDRLIEPYYSINGQPLGERNPRGLQDDFVKFIRFAESLLNQTGNGVFGYITNNSYFDNPTYRGMRHSLLKSYSIIFLLDLHGNSNLPRRTIEQLADENVFAIKQGVGITLAKKVTEQSKETCVYYKDLLASRSEKYDWLLKHSALTTEWQILHPRHTHWLFLPVNLDLSSEYEQYSKISEIMPLNSVGLYTARDDFAVAWSYNEIENRLKNFIKIPIEEARSRFALGKDTTEWQVQSAQEDVKNNGLIKDNITQIAYRPFDLRFTYYSGQSRGYMCRPRPEVMRHLLKRRNIALCFMRRSREDSISNFFVISQVVDKSILSSADNANVAPLWLYPEEKTSSFSQNSRPNFSSEFLHQLSARLGVVKTGTYGLSNAITPVDIFHYIYAVFHSPNYRSRYAEFLKIDFPRFPLTGNLEMFRVLAKLGGELVTLHLMESPEIDQHHTEFIGKQYLEVEKISWSKQTVWINKNQTTGFKGVPDTVWNFNIGGYQVCEKWLKDRKGRTLSKEDLYHYQKIISALAETIHLMHEIDEVIEHYGGWPKAFQTGDKKASAPPQGLLRF